MKNNEKAFKHLKKKYSKEELAEAVMLPKELTKDEEENARKEFAKFRLKKRESRSEKEQLLSSLLTLKYNIKAYLDSSQFKEENSFGNFLKSYLKIVKRSQKKLAEEIGLHPSRINRIIKGKERIGKSIAYRLESHSGEIIPALFWWKLIQKEIEQEILTEKQAREIERKHVTKVAYRA
ncbi:MAG: helix-turn-helix domain-containing protein [Bacteroidota bacterium]